MGFLRVLLLGWAVLLSAFGTWGLSAAVPAEAEETWYPFLQGTKWGFIDARGNWKIEPRFDDLHDLFDHETVRVMVAGKEGCIDRSGAWIVRPEFENLPSYWNERGFQIVARKGKSGILDGKGASLLPLEYDEIIPSSVGAWVRKGSKLGVVGFDGKWIHPLSIPWSATREIVPLPDFAGVAWIKATTGGKTKWGVINEDGKILFQPRFDTHVMSPRESEEWDHPEGTDFRHGKAWVKEKGGFLLITDEGGILTQAHFDTLRPWSETLFQFTRDKWATTGLIDESGKIVLGPGQILLEPLKDGAARYVIMGDGPDMGWAGGGFISEDGKILIPPGRYGGNRDFNEGLVVVGKSEQDAQGFHSWTVLLDKEGREVARAEGYSYSDVFAGGLAAVGAYIPGSEGVWWGYIDAKGRERIAPRFGGAKPFFRGRAWVCETPDNFDRQKYAMIDTSGKVLTDFAYFPPEKDSVSSYSASEILEMTRWRGNLAVLNGGWQVGLGLATADGKVLLAPQFNRLGPLRDGMILATTWDGRERRMGFVNDKGVMAIPATYTLAEDFDRGSAWVSRVEDDHGGHIRNEGWLLIDHGGKTLTNQLYRTPSFIVGEGYREYGEPQFMGELACVADLKVSRPYGDDGLRRGEWGYINHQGEVVAWHRLERVDSGAKVPAR